MKELLTKYAELMVRMGVNVQKDEEVFITSQTETAEFARIVAAEAYKAGARKVTVNWYDEKLSRLKYLSESKEALTDLHDWHVRRTEEMVDRKAVVIHIIADDPAIFEGVDASLISAVAKVNAERCKKYQDSAMSGNTRWTLAAYPTPEWARMVFGPELNSGEAVKKLWGLIASACRLNEKDTVGAWRRHQDKLDARRKILNEAGIRTLRFKNSLGTDLTLAMPDGYIFKGGADAGGGGVVYMANIPTEEVFSAPHRTSASGRAVASMPLIYQGNRIENFWLDFKNGKVSGYHAEKGLESLKELIETDEGSHYLGEVALVGWNSPIQNLKTLFFNTLFDENASCHLALGRAYPDCVKGGVKMTEDQLKAAGMNYSLEHEDFMIGTSDLSVTAETRDSRHLIIFKDGDWAI